MIGEAYTYVQGLTFRGMAQRCVRSTCDGFLTSRSPEKSGDHFKKEREVLMMIVDLFSVLVCIMLVWLLGVSGALYYMLRHTHRAPRGYTLLYSVHRDVTGRLYVARHGIHWDDPVTITISDRL